MDDEMFLDLVYAVVPYQDEKGDKKDDKKKDDKKDDKGKEPKGKEEKDEKDEKEEKEEVDEDEVPTDTDAGATTDDNETASETDSVCTRIPLKEPSDVVFATIANYFNEQGVSKKEVRVDARSYHTVGWGASFFMPADQVVNGENPNPVRAMGSAISGPSSNIRSNPETQPN